MVDLDILRNPRRSADAEGLGVRLADGSDDDDQKLGRWYTSSRWDVSDGPTVAVSGSDTEPQPTA